MILVYVALCGLLVFDFPILMIKRTTLIFIFHSMTVFSHYSTTLFVPRRKRRRD